MRQRFSRPPGASTGNKRGLGISRSFCLLFLFFIASYFFLVFIYLSLNAPNPVTPPLADSQASYETLDSNDAIQSGEDVPKHTSSSVAPIHLPYEYPVHRNLPVDRTSLSERLRSRYFGFPNGNQKDNDIGKGENPSRRNEYDIQRRRCWGTAGLVNGSHACLPIFPQVPDTIHEQLTLSGSFTPGDGVSPDSPPITGDGFGIIAEKLEKEFSFQLEREIPFSSSTPSPTTTTTPPQSPLLFYDGYDVPDVSQARNVNSPSTADSHTAIHNSESSTTPWWLFTPPPPKSPRVSPKRSEELKWEQQFLEDVNLPCTAHIQRRLHALQNPLRCEDTRYLVSPLKMGMHGVGSALTLVAHDLLSAIILNRVLLITIPSGSKWYFASDNCVSAGRSGWDCFFLPPSKCAYYDDDAANPSQGAPVFRRIPRRRAAMVDSVRHASRTTQRFIQKKTIDASGMSRSDMPSDALFFGEGYESLSCYQDYLRWVNDDTNRILQGTFAAAADNRLKYMLAQTLKYLTRAPQPWFRSMLRFHFHRYGLYGTVGGLHASHPSSQGSRSEGAVCSAAWYYSASPAQQVETQISRTSVVMYVQERGEIAKFREYYNVFGCHTMNYTLFTDYVLNFCGAVRNQQENRGLDCTVYISGNTPYERYAALRDAYVENGIRVLSTWEVQPPTAQTSQIGIVAGQHSQSTPQPESKRWGAGSPESSWIDLFAGVASAQWACVAQSNWCRLIDFLRLTSSRASCNMIDVGMLMMISPEDRHKYCIIGPYPTKPFSNVLSRASQP